MNETHRTSPTPVRRSLRLTVLVLAVPVLAMVLAFALTRSPASIFIAVLFVVAGMVYVSTAWLRAQSVRPPKGLQD
jgi:membrane protein YdbS with pleckstrin-like domain